MGLNDFEVLVIGAGAAGLSAALELALTGRKVGIIEACEKPGGRIKTYWNDAVDTPLEPGAEFVHGKLEYTRRLLEKAGARIYEVSGSIWKKSGKELEEQKDFITGYKALDKKFDELENDISVEQFIIQHLAGEEFEETRISLRKYVEGYYAGDTKKASTYALRDELRKSDDVQFRIEEGYQALVNYLHNECMSKGVSFFLSEAVHTIDWSGAHIKVFSSKNEWKSKKLLVTVPMGVLQSGTILFTPDIPGHLNAAKKLGFGPVVKTLLCFRSAFWKDLQSAEKNLDDFSFIFSESIIPTWWSYYPKKAAVLTGWSGGPHAEKISSLKEEEILQKAIDSLSAIFNLSTAFLQEQLLYWHVANWVQDRFTCGGYSYDVVNGAAAKKILQQPVNGKIYFAGEALFEGVEIGTVEAAIVNGRDTAHRMIAGFKS